MKERRRRCDGFFLDTLLISVWSAFGLIALLGFVFAAFPALQKAIGTFFTNERMIELTSLTLLGSTAYRILHHAGRTAWALPFSYVVVQVVYAALWTQGLMFTPVNILYAPVVPACVLAVCWIPLTYVWQRIKPLPRRPRKRRVE